MSNMSYCRFQNTLKGLDDCERHINDTDLSEEEEKARKKLIVICIEIAEAFREDDDDEEN